MKTVLLLLGMSANLGLYSCDKAKTSDEQTTASTASSAQPADSTVKASVTNKDGVKLDMTFDNAKQTATFELKGEVIETKQDMTGSGVKYSNAHYEYTEHQGEITLKKDGKTIFYSKK